jgi:ATP phosphoribosyltransferase
MSQTLNLRIALPRSEELPQICDHFRACGFDLPDPLKPGLHRLSNPLNGGFRYEVFSIDPADVGTYVEHGISHAGVMSTDLARENGVKVWRPFSFPFGRYPVVLAAPRGESIASLSARPLIRIATPLPNFTRELFATRGMSVEVVPVADSVTACLLGLADGYVDRLTDPELVVQQGFRVVEALGHASLKLVANRACGSRRRNGILKLIESLEEHAPAPPPEINIPFDEDDVDEMFRDDYRVGT